MSRFFSATCLVAPSPVTDATPATMIRRIAPAPPHPTSGSATVAEPPDVPPLTDRELLAALAASSPHAGHVLYDRLIHIVEWTILRIMGQRSAEHDDLVQGAFEQIVISLHEQRYAERCSLTSWASAVSCHVALNALRSRKRQRALQVEQAPRELDARAPGDLESQLAARQTLERVRAELARMNPGRAQVLLLHEVNGLELAEIATVLGISVMAAQSRLSRGRRELRARLGGGASPGGELDD
jgi:RNA polymerase sigma-70 factor, ECF subfamily